MEKTSPTANIQERVIVNANIKGIQINLALPPLAPY